MRGVVWEEDDSFAGSSRRKVMIDCKLQLRGYLYAAACIRLTVKMFELDERAMGEGDA